MVDDLYGTSDYGTTQPAAGGSTGKPPLRELRGAHDAGREPVWVIDDDRAIRWVLDRALARAGIGCRTFERGQDALNALEAAKTVGGELPLVLVSDIRMPGLSGVDLLTKVKELVPELPVIIMTAFSDLESAVSAFQGGAFEYLTKPFDVLKAVELISRAMEDARRRAHDLMQNVQNEAYALTDELRRIQKDEKTSAAQRAVRAREIARRDTETLLKKTDAKPQPVKEFVPLKEVQIGQEVVIADLGQTATVTARPDRNGMVEVRAGIMKTKVPLTNLRAPDKMEKRKPAEPRRSTRVQLDKSRKTSMELNLLGYTVDEALNEVDKFLDSGMLRGQSTLYIIHGNGTGALRTAIQKHLRTHKAVKSFRLGRYGEGESGVTVVELK